MGNSSEPMLEAASYVTGDNEHDGVADVIEKFVL
jgi:hydroxymethylpyrimidine pyrophosphatase-like HAD family hydrolase